MAARSRMASMVLSISASLTCSLFDFHLQAFVGAQLKLRQHFKTGSEFQRAILRVVHVIDLRLRYGNQLLVLDGLVDLLGNQRLQHFAFDVVGESAANQRNRRFAGPKSGNARDARKLARHPLDCLLHVGGGNF